MRPRSGTPLLSSLRVLLVLGCGLLVLLALSMGLTGLYYTGLLSDAASRTYTQEVVPLEALDDAKSALYRIRGDALEHVLAARAASQQRLDTEISEQERRARERLRDYEATRLREPEALLLAEFRRDFDVYVALVREQILPLSAAGRKDEAEAIARGSAVEVFREARDAMNALMDYNLERAEQRALAVEDDRREATGTLGLVLALIVACGLAVSLSLTRRINRPIGQIIAHLRELGRGGLDDDIAVGRADEFGQILSALRDTQERLRDSADERDRAHDQMRYQAFHDALSDLPNRSLFLDRLEHARVLQRRQHRPVHVLMLDLDGFKMINDTHGHAVGDALLREVAQRILSCARDVDTVARLSGDEFAVLVESGTAAEVVGLAERIVAALALPYAVNGRQLSVTCSAGVASGEAGGAAEDDLLRNADVAMYAAKAAGRNRVARYDEAMYEVVRRRSELEAALLPGLAAGEFRLVFQPVVAMTTGSVTSIEALLRWQRPDGRQVSAVEFIPLAEATGAIVEIGRWVLAEAARSAARLSAASGTPVTVAVNVAAAQLAHPDFGVMVRAVLDECGLPVQQLVLEVTESALVDPDGPALAALGELRTAGVRIAMDDFGTGYSSLGQLRMLPVDILKIDRSFISELDEDSSHAPVMAAVIAMAQSLSLSVVAEGVETAAQLSALRRLGCDSAQGFVLSRPVPEGDLGQVLTARAPFADLVSDHEEPFGDELLQVMAAVRTAVRGGGDSAHVVPAVLQAASTVAGTASAYLLIDQRGAEGTVRYAYPPDDPLLRAPGRPPRQLWSRTFTLETPEGRPRTVLVLADVLAREISASADKILQLLVRVLEEALGERDARPPRLALVVGGTDIGRLVLRSVLEGVGYDVESAPRTSDAVHRSRDAQLDLVLFDIDLQESTAEEGLRALQSAVPDVPLVVVSGSREHAARAHALGAAAYVLRTASTEELIGVVLGVDPAETVGADSQPPAT